MDSDALQSDKTRFCVQVFVTVIEFQELIYKCYKAQNL